MANLTGGSVRFRSRCSLLPAGLCLLLLTGSCLSSPDNQPSDDPAKVEGLPVTSGSLAMQASLPSLAQLEGVQARGSTPPAPVRSSLGVSNEYTYPGAQVVAKSIHVTLAATGEATILSGPGELDYVVCEAFNCGSSATQLTLDLSILQRDCWLALADFSSGRWQLFGPYTQASLPAALDIVGSQYFSPLQRQYFAVLVMDGAQASLNSFGVTIRTPDLLPGIVATDALRGARAVNLGGQPGIVYLANGSGGPQLSFAVSDRSASSLGLGWHASVIDPLATAEYFAVTEHKGRAVVLYTTADQTLWLAAAKVALPLNESDWDLRQLVSGRDCRYCSVISDGEHLHFALNEADFGDLDFDGIQGYLYYGHSNTADPLGSFRQYRITGLGDAGLTELAEPSIAMVGGTPAIVIENSVTLTLSSMLYCQSSQVLPGSIDWQVGNTEQVAETTGIRLAEIDGKPLIYFVASFPAFLQGLVSQPQGSTDWLYRLIFIGGSPPITDFVPVNGRPMFTYVYEGSVPHSLYVLSSSPLLDPATGVTQQVVQRTGIESVAYAGNIELSLVEMNGYGALAWCDQAAGILYFGRIAN